MRSPGSARKLSRVVHKPLILLRCKQAFEFRLDSHHPIQVLCTRQTFLPKTGVLKMHAIDGVNTHRVRDAQLPRQTCSLLERFLFGRTLHTGIIHDLLRRQQTGEENN